MARARNIKPGLFKNEILGVADPLFTLLFEGLWILADREGRLEDRPLRIKAEVFPYREGLAVEPMLVWLQTNGFIVRYAVDGARYIQILNFAKHQNPHKNESDSEIPSTEFADSTPEEIRSTSEKIGSTRADSLLLIPDSLFSDSGSLIPSPLIPEGCDPPPVGPRPPKAAKRSEPSTTAATFEAYTGSYRNRYGVDPIRNGKVNGQLAQFVARVGIEEAPLIAAHYVGMEKGWYVQSMHSIDCLLKDAEAIRTSWATGRVVTNAQAVMADRTATNRNAFQALIDKEAAKEIPHGQH